MQVFQVSEGDGNEVRRFDAEQLVGVLHGTHDVKVLARLLGEYLKHPDGAVNEICRGHEYPDRQID